ncbi:uncharacterized protein LOC113274591 [Papaver somniferum]|uniref:uncharacterized protein LOC113274591 n=1 Tax=Papaver somniferum TaxID=3469 RepID=UPI000E7032C4|nr:uncharacterized protein LOC113274591 [Papaver somniferum]XP_026379763.1 uncharacterized protein LOC113274591 [Papaver somniferum]
MASSDNKTQKRWKGLIRKEDIASDLTRYSTPTKLALLKEVAQLPDVIIDRNVLVKKTTTGIINAREYPMLWRHLAYCDKLPEAVDEKLEEQRLDDEDSDLEYELLEAFPPATDEASLEVASCVKVLLASGLSDDAGSPITVEAPFTTNMPTWQDFKSPLDNPQPCSLKGINIAVPVSVQKQSSAAVTTAKGLDGTVATTAKGLDGTVATTAKGLDGTVANAGDVQPAKRRKRTTWTLEEDNELIAAVKKLGERNWANILKADIFKGDRTASQLSQRWGIIRKRLSNRQNELTEQRLATNQAVTQALSMPMNNNLSAACTISPANLVASAATVNSQQIPLHTPKGTSGVIAKPRSITKRTAPVVPNPVIQAAVIAAGTRTATPPSAISVLKSCTIQGVTPPLAPNHSGARPNVHYICTGLSSASPTTYSTAVPSVSLPPPTPAVKCKVPSVSVLASASTSYGAVAAGRKTNRVTSAGVGNTLEEEKAQNSSKEVVKNSSNEEEVNNSLRKDRSSL